jgi:hypothetical protein
MGASTRDSRVEDFIHDTRILPVEQSASSGQEEKVIDY